MEPHSVVVTPSGTRPERAPKTLFLAFGILAVGIVTAGYFSYRAYETQYRIQVERQLLAVAELKVRDLARWRMERLADGEVFRRNPVFSSLVSRSLTNPRDAEAERLLRTWLSQARGAYGYDRLILLDDRGVERLTIPDTPEPASPHLARDAAEVLRSGQVAFLDLHREAPGGPIHLAVLVPILRERGDGRPLGVLVLRIDPATYLYPSIQRWPVPSRTSEILIVRRDGNDALYLNALRFREDAALNLRIPITRTDVPAVRAVLGREGAVDGTDYRGVPVAAALRSVPGSPWFVVAKTDVSEAYAPLRQRLWTMALLVAALVAGAGAAIGWLWRRRSTRFYQEQYEAQRERQRAEDAERASEAKFRAVFEHSSVGKSLTSPDGRLLEVNSAFAALLGYTIEEMSTLNFAAVTHPDDVAESRECIRCLLAGERSTYSMEKRYLHRNGSLVWTSVNTSLLRGEDGAARFFVTNIQDITERKRTEESLRKSEREFRETLSHLDEAYYSVTADGLILDHNPAFNRILGIDAGQDMRGRRSPDLWLNPDDRQAYLDELTTKGFLRNYLANMKTASGEKVVVLVNSHLERDEQGGLVRIVGTFSDFTERKRAEEALRESAARYRTLVESIPQKVFVKDRQSRFVSINENFARDLGIRPEAVVGKLDYDLFPKELADKYRADDTRIMETGQGEELEERYLQEGRETWVQTRKTPVRDENGEIVGVCGVFADITARKLAEEALRSSEERFRVAAESVADVVYEWDLKTALTWYGDVDGLMGYPAGGFPRTFDGWAATVHSEDTARVWAAVDGQLKGAAPYDVEYRIAARDGAWRWWSARGTVLRDERGQPQRWIGAITDVTERKRAEEALRDANEHLEGRVLERTAELARSKELLVETGRLARVGGWEIDLKKNELSWTDVVYQIHEVGPEFRPTVATGIQFYAPEAVPVISEAVRRGIEDGEPWDLELPLITAKGNRLWVRAIGQGYRENGVVVRVGGVFHDITARKLADDELKKHRDHLEELVNERTAELAKAVQDLERSNKELEQFAYVASHDLQEPLRMVSSYTQLLGQRYEGQLDEKAKKYIDYAVDGAVRMQRLINDLLVYSRVGTRGRPLEPADAHAVLGEAVVNLAAAIEESGAMITNDDLPTVRTDASQLVQVFQNLLANAIKFRGAEPPRVHVSAADQGREWVFSVRDNGIGIERQYAARVFVIFQRLHTRQEYPGTGIGLALSKRIVERHGGRIWFESEPGTGSTFFFTVPK